MNFQSLYIVILNYNCALHTINCLRSLRNSKYKEFFIVVVDNFSSDNSKEIIISQLSQNDFFIQTESNLGYSGGNNIGIRYALQCGAKYILIINPDCEVDKNFLLPLVKTLDCNSDISIVCPLIIDRDTGLIQAFGGKMNLRFFYYERYLYKYNKSVLERGSSLEPDYVPGACFLIRSNVFHKIGEFDESFFLYFEDVDLSLKAKANGLKTLAISDSLIYHTDSKNRGNKSYIVNFYSSRNQIWINKRYCTFKDIIISFTFLLLYIFPKKIFSRFIHGYWFGLLGAITGTLAGLCLKPNDK